MASPNGKTIASFRVEEEIGQGGMGVVLRARQDTLGRSVVLKKLRRELADQPELLERFRRESRAAAAVHHHNVVAVYDFFPWRGDHYIAQEYVDGVDLREALEQTAPLPWRIAALVALEMARGLEEIHAAGTVHRDLKPANVLLGRRGEVKIADFGIALEASGAPLTRPGVAIGSPAYMSPEQMMGERLDARSDLFSLAVVVYEMLAGAPPHARAPESDADEDDTLLARMRGERYPRLRRRAPGTPRFLARLVRSGLRARPRRRLATTRELRGRLERGLGHPSSADARSEIAAWLWGAHVFQRRDSETLVQVSAAPAATPRTVWRTWALGAACVAIFASVLLVDVRPAPPPVSETAVAERGPADGDGAQEGAAPAEPGARPDDLPGEAQAPSRVR